MFHINHPDYFPALKLKALQARAEQWAARWPGIKRIILSRQLYFHDKDYLLWVQADSRVFDSYSDFLNPAEEWAHIPIRDHKLVQVYQQTGLFRDGIEWSVHVQLLNGPPEIDPWWGEGGFTEEKGLLLLPPGEDFASDEFWWELYRREGDTNEERLNDFFSFPSVTSIEEHDENRAGWEAAIRLRELDALERELRETKADDVSQLEKREKYLNEIGKRRAEIKAWFAYRGPLPENIEDQITLGKIINSPIESTRQSVQYAFLKEGPSWAIVWEGKRYFGFRGRGFETLHFLVRNPHQEFNIMQISACTEYEPKRGIEEENYAHNSEGVSHEWSHQQIADKKAIQAARKELENLWEEKREACQRDDIETEEGCDKKIKKLQSYLNEKAFPVAEQKRELNRIGTQLERAIKNIEKICPQLGAHFRKSLGSLYSSALAYRPDNTTEWKTE